MTGPGTPREPDADVAPAVLDRPRRAGPTGTATSEVAASQRFVSFRRVLPSMSVMRWWPDERVRSDPAGPCLLRGGVQWDDRRVDELLSPEFDFRGSLGDAVRGRAG